MLPLILIEIAPAGKAASESGPGRRAWVRSATEPCMMSAGASYVLLCEVIPLLVTGKVCPATGVAVNLQTGISCPDGKVSVYFLGGYP
jgi:hypothetical protein